MRRIRARKVNQLARRSFTLPATLDPSQISASYQDGVLTITVPPREEARPKQIPIETK